MKSTFRICHQHEPPTPRPWFLVETYITSDGPRSRLPGGSHSTLAQALADRDERVARANAPPKRVGSVKSTATGDDKEVSSNPLIEVVKRLDGWAVLHTCEFRNEAGGMSRGVWQSIRSRYNTRDAAIIAAREWSVARGIPLHPDITKEN